MAATGWLGVCFTNRNLDYYQDITPSRIWKKSAVLKSSTVTAIAVVDQQYIVAIYIIKNSANVLIVPCERAHDRSPGSMRATPVRIKDSFYFRNLRTSDESIVRKDWMTVRLRSIRGRRLKAFGTAKRVSGMKKRMKISMPTSLAIILGRSR